MSVLRQGSRGNEVRDLQQRLTAKGHDTNGVDGIFGGDTYTAVCAFQRASGLSVDGIVGNDTWSALLSTATPTGPVPATPDTNGWRAALQAQQAGVEWVAQHQQWATDCIPPDTSDAQRTAAEWMIGLIGIQEDLGANKGTALTPGLIQPYIDYWSIAGLDALMWCVLTAWAAYMEGKGGNYLDKQDWKNTDLCPLGNWWGSAYDTYTVAIEKGCWVPIDAIDTLTPARLCGAILVKNNRDGSDAAAASTGNRWPGHGDLYIGVDATAPGKILVVGGNLGNTCKAKLARTGEYLGLVLLQ